MDRRISEAEAREYAAMTWALAARAEAAGNVKLAKELVERARKADELWARSSESDRHLSRCSGEKPGSAP